VSDRNQLVEQFRADMQAAFEDLQSSNAATLLRLSDSIAESFSKLDEEVGTTGDEVQELRRALRDLRRELADRPVAQVQQAVARPGRRVLSEEELALINRIRAAHHFTIYQRQSFRDRQRARRGGPLRTVRLSQDELHMIRRARRQAADAN